MKNDLNNELSEEIFNKILLEGNFCLELKRYTEFKKTAIILKSLGYLETPHVNPDIFSPTELGKLVLQSGGWKDYNKNKKQQKEKDDKKEHYELQNIKFKYYSFWPVLVLSLIGGVYSIIQIAKSLKEENKNKTEQTKSDISSQVQKKLTIRIKQNRIINS
jgi:hypothetical protein